MWKVININAIVNEKNNIATDTIFFFQTYEEAEDYMKMCKKFQNASKNKNREQILKECTEEEEFKYGFEQYDEIQNPNNLKIPNIVIEHPINVPIGVPYWVTTRELWMKRPQESHESSKNKTFNDEDGHQMSIQDIDMHIS